MKSENDTNNTAGSDCQKRLVRALRRLEKDWPDGYMLFANNGSLHLVKGGYPADGGRSVAHFEGIFCDGGDADEI